MRWVGFLVGAAAATAKTTTLRASTQSRVLSTDRDYSRVAVLSKLWEKFNMRQEILESPDDPRVEITRSARAATSTYHHFEIQSGCPRVIVRSPKKGKIETMKQFAQGHLRNAFVRGAGLNEDKEELLEGCSLVLFEVLRAVRVGDFSSLTEFMLGGNEALQFHRKAADKLTKRQKEALNITEEDFLGDSGYLLKYPYIRDELGPYIHSIDLVSSDAVGSELSTEDGKPKVFCRYKVVFGALYKFETLRKEVVKDTFMWNQKIKTPKDYNFKWPRYVFVELDFCQEAINRMPIQLEPKRLLYDFHVFSF